MKIVPAILAISEEEYKQKIEKLWDSNLFDRDFIQIDLMDGEFVKNKSVGPEVIKKYPTSFKIEAHLMVNNPYYWATELKDFHQIQRFIIPIELQKEKLDQFIGFIRALTDAEIGFSLNPETSFSEFEKSEYLNVAESILIMSVKPGFSGQEFIPETLEKVRQTTSLMRANGLDCKVGVDGGVSLKNIKEIFKAGADYVVIGSSLFEGDLVKNVESLNQKIAA